MENTKTKLSELNKELIALQDQYEHLHYHIEKMGMHLPNNLENPFKYFEASYMHEIEKEIKEKKEFLYLLDKATHHKVYQQAFENTISTLID